MYIKLWGAPSVPELTHEGVIGGSGHVLRFLDRSCIAGLYFCSQSLVLSFFENFVRIRKWFKFKIYAN
jgi:hypothetical protein